MNARRDVLAAIVRDIAPCTVRQVFYQATVRDVIEKTEAGYDEVQTLLADMRRSGTIAYADIVDNTRRPQQPLTFDSLAEAMTYSAQHYRRSLWTHAPEQVEVWLEKDALAGVIYPVTAQWDLPLMVARGYSSLSFLAEAAEAIRDGGRRTFVYHLGDFDPSGVNAGEVIERTLREFAPRVEIHFERIAVNPAQIAEWRLPTRPTKRSDSRAARFGSSESVELDAIAPAVLRELVAAAIARHVDMGAVGRIEAAQERERDFLARVARHGQGARP